MKRPIHWCHYPDHWSIDKCYHPEYGSDVYQPRVSEIERFIEPFVTMKEAEAYLQGARDMMKQKGESQ